MYYFYNFVNDEIKVSAFKNSFSINKISIYSKEDKLILDFENDKSSMILGEIYENENNKFMVLKADQYIYEINSYPILIGDNKDINIKNFKGSINNNILSISYSNNIYINYKKINSNTVKIELGDVIIIDSTVLVYAENQLISIGKILDTKINYIFRPYRENYNYISSPKINKYLEDEIVEIKNPGEKPRLTKGGILKIVIPPLIAIAGSIFLAVYTKRGAMIIVSVLTTVCALIFTIVSFVNEQKDIKDKTKFRFDSYTKHLLDFRKKLFKLQQGEKEYYKYKYPSINTIDNMIFNEDSRLYERSITDDDFLTIFLGYYDGKPYYTVKYNYDELKYGNDKLIEEGKTVYDKYNVMENIPQVIDLKSSNLGLVGNKNLVHQEMKRIILDLAFFQSYHNLNMVILTEEIYNNEFDFVNWLPHFKLKDLNISTNVINEQMREIVLGNIYNMLRVRKLNKEQNEKDNTFIPHIILFIDEFKLIMNHPIMEFLNDNEGLGISLIISANQKSDLISNVDTVFQLKDGKNGVLQTLKTVEVNRCLVRDVKQKDDYEQLAREISKIEHKIGIDNSIPSMVDFLEIYDVDTVEELDIKNRWKESNIHKSINVPLGKKTASEKLFLNLHEKAHGPHGLVAGTTGSGKSEIIQSYILSLAVTFSPYEVGFLLIDFKGGGMANLFTHLPHLIGTITNLDGNESKRALASIRAELKYRQEVFNEHNVNNINLYNELFKNGSAKEPLPHLFIISDEFAELKKEQPEFMSELVSVARIGRTLGVHLILATQKPSGVVDDQIWSNSKFKLALKVQDESDSKEMLRTPDAAHITQTGRAYLQVGNNEIYELFQSAWSGAPYVQESKEINIDKNIYEINNLGQGEIINDDFSDEYVERNTTQLEAVIDEINKVYKTLDYKEVRKTWCPSLEAQMIKSIEVHDDLEKINTIHSKVEIGKVDIPSKQQQLDYIVDINEDANILIYGSSGYGKSKSIGNIITRLCSYNNPNLLNFYILDFGNSGLIGYKGLPHVANYISFDNKDKVSRLIKRIDDLIDKRRKLIAEADVNNISMYEKSTNKTLERIIVVIDGYETLISEFEDFGIFLEKTSRISNSLGISFIISTSKLMSIKQGIKNNFDHIISLYLNDTNDMNDAVGRCDYPLDGKIEGRSIVKFDNNISQMQLYLPIKYTDDIEYQNGIKTIINSINDNYHGEPIKGIPDVKADFNTNDLNAYEYMDENKNNIIGISKLDLEKVGINKFNDLFVISGPNRSGKSNAMKILLSYYPGACIIDSSNESLIHFNNDSYRYYSTKEQYEEFKLFINEQITKRKQEDKNLLEDRFVFIDDYDDFYKNINDSNFVELMSEANKVRIKFIIGYNSDIQKPFGDELLNVIKSCGEKLFVGYGNSESDLPPSIKIIPRKEGYLKTYDYEKGIKLLIPKYEERKDAK